jgi:hypothetical protein
MDCRSVRLQGQWVEQEQGGVVGPGQKQQQGKGNMPVVPLRLWFRLNHNAIYSNRIPIQTYLQSYSEQGLSKGRPRQALRYRAMMQYI